MFKMSTIGRNARAFRRLRKSLKSLLIVVCGKSSQICCFYNVNKHVGYDMTSTCLQSFPVIHDVSIASSVLPTTDKVTSLGVILDSKLTFDAHICSLSRMHTFTSELYAISDPPSPLTWPLPLQSPWYSHA